MLMKLLNMAIRMANRAIYTVRVIIRKYPLFALASAAVVIFGVIAIAVMLIRPNFGGDTAIGGDSPIVDGKYPETGVVGGINGYVSEDDIQNAINDFEKTYSCCYLREIDEYDVKNYGLNVNRCWISKDRCQYVFLIESYSKVLGVNVYTMCSFDEVGKENATIVLNSYNEYSISDIERNEIICAKEDLADRSYESWYRLREVYNNEK